MSLPTRLVRALTWHRWIHPSIRIVVSDSCSHNRFVPNSCRVVASFLLQIGGAKHLVCKSLIFPARVNNGANWQILQSWNSIS